LNYGNHLAKIIRQENVGSVSEDGSANALAQLALGLIDSLEVDAGCLQRIETKCPADADTLATDFD
jgi:hypothetical protein